MDIVDFTESPCFVYTYQVQVFTKRHRQPTTTSQEAAEKEETAMILEPEACRLYKGLEDAKKGAKHILALYNSTEPSSDPIIYITKTLSIWDAEAKHITLLETPFQLNCNMEPQMMIPDPARGYYLGGQKKPVFVICNEIDSD